MAHFAGRILGTVEPTIYAMIGLMIVAMGLGAFAAKWVSSIFKGFAWLELTIGLLGGSSVLLMSAVVAFAYTLPEWLRVLYGVDAFVELEGGFIETLRTLSRVLPFILGFAIGLFIGMEIPLIARVREVVHEKHLEHNLGTMYGADYIGAGIGAAIWVLICLKIPIAWAAVGTATLNVLVGIVFLIVYRRQTRPALGLWVGHGVLVVLLVFFGIFGTQWITRMGDTLFKDRVVHQLHTPYQNVVITNRQIASDVPDVLSLYINGRLQFASNDEQIYHAYLTTPAMVASNRRDRLLVVGGGDGLALRDLLRWNPSSVTLIDIDPELLDLFAGRDRNAPTWVSEALTDLNENALNDPRVEVIRGDAFIEVEQLAQQLHTSGAHFDAIVIDLPDPSHPDLNKLYSNFFYSRIRNLLAADGAVTIQSTSPYHAKRAFQSIGKTLAHAGFTTDQYHANVPSFGEWGWTIGTLTGRSGAARIEDAMFDATPDGLLDKKQLQAAFVFAPGFYDNLDDIAVNRLGSHAVFEYHQQAFQQHQGVFYVDTVTRRTGR